tara:strand:+ start:1144 stop:1494 length:351 start_codon:yes stop_codon:yes gene_type:complete
MDERSPSEIFRERLKHARNDLRGMTQKQLSEASRIPTTSIAHFEGGNRKPSFENLANLAAALEVTIDYLLGRSESPNVAASVDLLARDGSKLTAENRQMALDFIHMLQKREAERKS